MPSANPFTDHGGGPVLTFTQSPDAGTVPVNTAMYTSPNSLTSGNAAGTSENVALHVAVIVISALVIAFLFRASGFRFVVAAGG